MIVYTILKIFFIVLAAMMFIIFAGLLLCFFMSLGYPDLTDDEDEYY